MTGPGRLWHGGIPGLKPGDLIQPVTDGQRRAHDGCPTCRARNSGQPATHDPAPARPDRVYLTSDRLYARYYASLTGRGDLYVAEPVGGLEPSTEDHFPTWTAPQARVILVYDRAVTLAMGERRRLLRRWIEADHQAAGTLHVWQAMSAADQRRVFEREWAALWRQAAAQVGGAR